MSPIRLFWLVAGLASLAAGVIGIVVPLLPTVPFLLLAAFCFARSSQRLHDWLVNHKTFGPPIRNWRDHGAIPPKAKRLAIVSIVLTFAISLWLQIPAIALGIQAIVLSAVTLFIWTRPDR